LVGHARTVGVDLAAQAKQTAVCLVSWDEGRATVDTLAVGADDVALVDLIESEKPAKVAIDAPFGWPAPFVSAVTEHAAGAAWDERATPGLRLRTTDLHVIAETGQQPLRLPDDLREQARADGVFDKSTADAVKEVVTLFEVFARDQFMARVAGHEEIVKQRGRVVFQRLDDLDGLFLEHVGTSISGQVPEDVWSRLQVVFQERHVLVHGQGIVDEQYVQRVAHTRQQVGQGLVLSRRDAEQALDALEVVVRAVAARS
jgi:hypothetical protein